MRETFKSALRALWRRVFSGWAKRVAERTAENERRAREAAAIAAARHQNAMDVMNCEGPCSNPYGCMVGLCVRAAVRRMREVAPPPSGETGGGNG